MGLLATCETREASPSVPAESESGFRRLLSGAPGRGGLPTGDAVYRAKTCVTAVAVAVLGEADRIARSGMFVDHRGWQNATVDPVVSTGFFINPVNRVMESIVNSQHNHPGKA